MDDDGIGPIGAGKRRAGFEVDAVEQVGTAVVGGRDLHVARLLQNGGDAERDAVIARCEFDAGLVRQHDAAGGVLRAGQQRDGPPVFEPAFEHEKGSKAVLGRFTRRALGPRLALRALGAAANTAAAAVLPPHELGPAVRIEFIHIAFTPLLKNFCPSICARRGRRSPPLPRPDGTFHKERAPLWCFAVQFDKVIKFLSDFAQNNIDILF